MTTPECAQLPTGLTCNRLKKQHLRQFSSLSTKYTYVCFNLQLSERMTGLLPFLRVPFQLWKYQRIFTSCYWIVSLFFFFFLSCGPFWTLCRNSYPRGHCRCSLVSLKCSHISSQWPGRGGEPSTHHDLDKCLIDERRTLLKEIPAFPAIFMRKKILSEIKYGLIYLYVWC